MNPKTQTVTLLGVQFKNLSVAIARQQIADLLTQKTNARIFTPNSEILYQANKNPALSELLSSADLLLPDGIGVLLAARLKGTPLLDRIPGIDTGRWILEYTAKHHLSVFLLGGKDGVAEQAAQRLSEEIPALCICGTHHGYFNKTGTENQQIIKKIQNAAPDVLFVCFGFPEQEKWIAENTANLPSLRLSIGLGGSLDVWSGNLRRAPLFFQKCGLEWLWRAWQEPKRFLNLIHIPLYIGIAFQERFQKTAKEIPDVR